MLKFTSPWLFHNYQLLLINPFTFFTHPPNPYGPMVHPVPQTSSPLATTSSLSVCMSLFPFFCCSGKVLLERFYFFMYLVSKLSNCLLLYLDESSGQAKVTLALQDKANRTGH